MNNQKRMTRATYYCIYNYYRYLYDSYQMKTVSEIASTLGLGESTIRLFFNLYYEGQNANGKFKLLDIMILTSTIFNKNNKYSEDQKKINRIMIERRLKRLKLEKQALMDQQKEKEVGNQKVKTGKM